MRITSMNPRPWRLLLAACLLQWSCVTGAAELVVIVSAKSPVTSLRPDQVADIFLAQTGRFPGGEQAVALDLPLGAPLRNEFYSTMAAKSPAMMKAYWTKMVFTGRGQPPRELASSAAVRRMVADNPAMIGYIDRAALDPSVKVVAAQVPR